MTNDLVSDMLTRIRNASLAKHAFTKIQYSKLNLAILKVLQNEGYIKDFFVEKKENTGKSEKIPEIKKTFNKWVQNEKNGRKWGEKKN